MKRLIIEIKQIAAKFHKSIVTFWTKANLKLKNKSPHRSHRQWKQLVWRLPQCYVCYNQVCFLLDQMNNL